MKPSNDAVQENDTESVISVEPKEHVIHQTKEVNTYYFYLVRLFMIFLIRPLQKMTIGNYFFNQAIGKYQNKLSFLNSRDHSSITSSKAEVFYGTNY